MEESSNFVPLGIPRGKLPFDQPARPARREGKTPGERKQIAREIRNAAKKEKKLIKADAKRARKLNAVMHRRMTKNPEKYVKNKDRNRIRALDQERRKIQIAAVQQAERLAAKHDPSGKMFNVGEVVVLRDGAVKTKEVLGKIVERKAQREAENAAKEAAVNPERAGLIQGLTQEKPKKGKISNKQKKRQAALHALQAPPPPRPVLPEGISVPEGEENFIAMWDITDEEIHKRMSNEKRVKSMERKNLRRKQKEEKRFNQAMKLLKRQTENRGVKWDPVEGRKIVLREQEAEASEEDSQDSGSDDDWENEEDKIEKPVEEQVKQVNIEKESKKSKKAKKDSEPTSTGDVVEAPAPEPQPEKKTSKRPAEDEPVEEPKAKKSKKSKKSKSEDVEVVVAPASTEPETAPTEKKKKKKRDKKDSSEVATEVAPEPEVELAPEPEVDSEQIRKEKKQAKKEKKRLEKEGAEVAKSSAVWQKPSKKRKHEDDDVEADAPVEKEKSHNKKNSKSEDAPNNGSTSAEQWNPDALTGDAARKDKFLRLLGAGKTNAGAADGAKHKSSAKVQDITKVQSELERQYETGMKMKHDGGSKRRGLGA